MSRMSNTLLILGGIALVGAIGLRYKHIKDRKKISTEAILDGFSETLEAEKIELLSLSDVTNYFKSLSLKKGVDVPFLAVVDKDGIRSYIMATSSEKSGEIENAKMISPAAVDDELLNILADKKLVVLS